MTRNQLPEGVGKKIVEALKRQAEADIAPMDDVNNSIGNALPLTEIEDLPEIQYEPLNELQDSGDDLEIIEEDNSYKFKQDGVSQNIMEQPVFAEPKVQPAKQQPYFNSVTLNQEKLQQAIMQSTNSKTTIPANVATLKNLINSLPVGVTKQTGAQIIRQTLEAMGIPMNSVLKEAQVFQEELNSSSRECMLKIQEYKTQIMQLEASIQDYQQNMTQVNDIISLFLATDK
ncbi:MAG: hypothetical protein E7Z90_02420 [Cyanobacteria bacterium SIG29]|nr:hypothetical protein [Cyanobacteria bacterium SIG29]